MPKSVCIFAASSMRLDESYHTDAHRLGQLLGEAGWRLVFGGGEHGLMGAVAKGVHDAGGHVLGIIPEKLDLAHVTYAKADEWIVTKDLRDRKSLMEERSDAFVVLPGGFGTLEELMETITMKQLDFHRRPIVILNTNGYYNALFAFFDHMVDQAFVKKEHLKLVKVVSTPEGAIAGISEYNDPEAVSKY